MAGVGIAAEGQEHDLPLLTRVPSASPYTG
jgi:hypothetical protein